LSLASGSRVEFRHSNKQRLQETIKILGGGAAIGTGTRGSAQHVFEDQQQSIKEAKRLTQQLKRMAAGQTLSEAALEQLSQGLDKIAKDKQFRKIVHEAKMDELTDAMRQAYVSGRV
jgi:hypothetical protein